MNSFILHARRGLFKVRMRMLSASGQGRSYFRIGARRRSIALATATFATGACAIGFGMPSCTSYALADEAVVGSINHANLSVRTGDHEVDDIMRVLEVLIPGFDSSTARVTCIVGGITNRIYKVTGNVNGGHVIVRLYGAKTELIIDRDEENRSFKSSSWIFDVMQYIDALG